MKNTRLVNTGYQPHNFYPPIFFQDSRCTNLLLGTSALRLCSHVIQKTISEIAYLHHLFHLSIYLIFLTKLLQRSTDYKITLYYVYNIFAELPVSILLYFSVSIANFSKFLGSSGFVFPKHKS